MSGRRLVVQRKILGMTQEEAAKRIGISRSTLSQYELDKLEPGEATWAKIAQVYKMPVEFLRGDDLMIDTCESGEMIFTKQEKKLPDDEKTDITSSKKSWSSFLERSMTDTPLKKQASS